MSIASEVSLVSEGKFYQWFNGLRKEAKFLGWMWVLGYRVLKRLGIKEVAFQVEGLAEKAVCRVEGSDIYEYTQSLGNRVEPFDLGFTPEVIIDAGANVGFATLRFKKMYPMARIIAIEPESRNVLQFQKNCMFYPDVMMLPTALWTSSRRLRIESMNVGSNAFQVIEDPAGDITGISVLDLIRTFSLDRIDLFKIDIEGSEKPLFDHPSAQLWLPRVRALLVETHDGTLGIKGCSESVRKAVSELFLFRGYINEYEYYVSKAYALAIASTNDALAPSAEAVIACHSSADRSRPSD